MSDLEFRLPDELEGWDFIPVLGEIDFVYGCIEQKWLTKDFFINTAILTAYNLVAIGVASAAGYGIFKGIEKLVS